MPLARWSEDHPIWCNSRHTDAVVLTSQCNACNARAVKVVAPALIGTTNLSRDHIGTIVIVHLRQIIVRQEAVPRARINHDNLDTGSS